MLKHPVIIVLGSLIGGSCIEAEKHDELFESYDNYKKMNHHLFVEVESDNLGGNNYFTVHEASGSVARRGEKDSLTRVAEIVAHYAKEHANECISIFSKRLREKYEKLGQLARQRVCYIAGRLNGVSNDKYGQIARDTIKNIARDNLDKKYFSRLDGRREGYKGLNEFKLRELYEEYLVEPCKMLVALNNNELFEYYRKWTHVFESDEVLPPKFEDSYKVCKHLIGKNLEKLYNLFRSEADRHWST